MCANFNLTLNFSINYNFKILKKLNVSTCLTYNESLKVELLITFQGTKYFVSWLRDTSKDPGMYKHGFMEILLGFLSTGGNKGVVNDYESLIHFPNRWQHKCRA
jgi:hypothetical protein